MTAASGRRGGGAALRLAALLPLLLLLGARRAEGKLLGVRERRRPGPRPDGPPWAGEPGAATATAAGAAADAGPGTAESPSLNASAYAVLEDNTTTVASTAGGAFGTGANCCSLKKIVVTEGGRGYLDPPAVTFSGGGGHGAKATAVLSGGTVIRIELDLYSKGIDYASPPTVLVAPPPTDPAAELRFRAELQTDVAEAVAAVLGFAVAGDRPLRAAGLDDAGAAALQHALARLLARRRREGVGQVGPDRTAGLDLAAPPISQLVAAGRTIDGIVQLLVAASAPPAAAAESAQTAADADADADADAAFYGLRDAGFYGLGGGEGAAADDGAPPPAQAATRAAVHPVAGSHHTAPREASPGPKLVPFVLGVSSYGGRSPTTNTSGTTYYRAGDRIYLWVHFSEPIGVHADRAFASNIPAAGVPGPELRLATGLHHQADAHNATATFLAGGVGETKRFWKNNAPSPLRTAAVPCRGGAPAGSAAAGPEWCLLAANETRAEESLARTLVFEYAVSTQHRSCLLDVLPDSGPEGALVLNGAQITNAAFDAGTGYLVPGAFAADLRLPIPADPTAAGCPPGGPGSLSATSGFVLGPAYVVSVRALEPDGTYGFSGYAPRSKWSPRRDGQFHRRRPNRVRLAVRFSQPVRVTCAWLADVCTDVTLALVVVEPDPAALGGGVNGGEADRGDAADAADDSDFYGFSPGFYGFSPRDADVDAGGVPTSRSGAAAAPAAAEAAFYGLGVGGGAVRVRRTPLLHQGGAGGEVLGGKGFSEVRSVEADELVFVWEAERGDFTPQLVYRDVRALEVGGTAAVVRAAGAGAAFPADDVGLALPPGGHPASLHRLSRIRVDARF